MSTRQKERGGESIDPTIDSSTLVQRIGSLDTFQDAKSTIESVGEHFHYAQNRKVVRRTYQECLKACATLFENQCVARAFRLRQHVRNYVQGPEIAKAENDVEINANRLNAVLNSLKPDDEYMDYAKNVFESNDDKHSTYASALLLTTVTYSYPDRKICKNKDLTDQQQKELALKMSEKIKDGCYNRQEIESVLANAGAKAALNKLQDPLVTL